MKRKLFFVIPAFALLLFATSCSKDDPATQSNVTVVGKWMGTGQYGTAAGSPTYPFTLTFKTDGSVDIIGNDNSGPSTGNGTWQLVQDSIKGTYSYTSGFAVYNYSGKFSTSSNVITGTIGLGASSTGIGLFSVTKQ